MKGAPFSLIAVVLIAGCMSSAKFVSGDPNASGDFRPLADASYDEKVTIKGYVEKINPPGASKLGEIQSFIVRDITVKPQSDIALIDGSKVSSDIPPDGDMPPDMRTMNPKEYFFLREGDEVRVSAYKTGANEVLAYGIHRNPPSDWYHD